MLVLILPNQLFELKYLPKDFNEVILWEHPHYFKKYNYNKLKLILHRASMKHYEYYLKKNKYKVQYIQYNKKPNFKKGYVMFQSADDLKLKPTEIFDNPNFLLNDELQKKYNDKTDKFFFNNFYMFFKKELDILPNIKSKDKHNRESIPPNKTDIIPKEYNLRFSTIEQKIINEAIKYIKKQFPKSPGPDWNKIRWLYPINHEQAKKLLQYFISKKINQGYGKYQDYMFFNELSPGIKNNKISLYHSLCSSSINIGLLIPKEIIQKVLKVKNINSKEAYIRQLFWREYQLYCYNYCKPLRTSKGRFSGNKSLSKSWYNTRTGIYPIDYCINKAFQTGYLHHIERLMVIGNFMLLSGISPRAGFRWFMEFSIDSYEWVMYQNVMDMVFSVTGGLTMRRIYISSSNYILKMSNLTKGESKEWSEKWDELYHNFIKNNKGKVGYPYE